MDKIQAIDLIVLLKLNSAFINWGFLNNFFAEYLTYSLPLVLVALWFYPARNASSIADAGGGEKMKKVALQAGFSVILAWPIIAGTIGLFVHRARPFNSGGVQELVFHRPTYSFPSDHASALFAVAMSFYLSGYRKLSYIMFVIAAIICFFRIATGIHWPTDIFAGTAIGLLSAWVIKLVEPYLSTVYSFIIQIAKKIKLA